MKPNKKANTEIEEVSNYDLDAEINREIENEKEEKTAWEQLEEQVDDDEIPKPPWKAYNSIEGSIYMNPLLRKARKKYKHGDKLPNGETINAPKLSSKQFA